MKKVLLSALILAVSFSAQAGLVGVKSIEISNALPTWLQVAEVVAKNTSGTDVALSSSGAIATAPDTWSAASTPSKAIDGSTNGAFPNIFHEGSDGSWDTLTITLPTIEELLSIQIFGRTDCCDNRDLYSVSFLDASGFELFTTQVDSRFGANPIVMLPNTTAVSEPATLALLGLALAGLGFSRRKV